jgi:hypothetical protein
MSHIAFRTLILAAIGLSLAGVSYSQVSQGNPLSPLKGLWNRPDYDAIDRAERIDEFARRELMALRKTAIDALEAKNYPAAEQTLGELVLRNPTTTDAHFLMGVAKIGLGKWEDARISLEAAVLSEPQRPEPKTRLGLTYVKLDNADAAMRQRADLASLDVACRQACADATWIKDGIVVLDEALNPSVTAPLAAAGAVPSPSAIASIKNFDPATYNIVTFSDSADLYDLLTRDGRCAAKKLAEPRQPCALILYRPDERVPGGLSANFKPVFRIDSRASVWAIHDKKLQKVKIEDLYFDIEDIIGEGKAKYRSVAVIGNAENKANCDKGRTCLGNLVAEDMFRMYNSMPDSVVEVIWGPYGMKDVGTIRVK